MVHLVSFIQAFDSSTSLSNWTLGLLMVCFTRAISSRTPPTHLVHPVAKIFPKSIMFLSSLATGTQLDASPLPPGGRSNLHYTHQAWLLHCTANVTGVVKPLKTLHILWSIKIRSTRGINHQAWILHHTSVQFALQMWPLWSNLWNIAILEKHKNREHERKSNLHLTQQAWPLHCSPNVTGVVWLQLL